LLVTTFKNAEDARGAKVAREPTQK